MNTDELIEISQQLSSEDVLELKEGKNRLKSILCEENILTVLTSEQKKTVEDLLHQIISTESIDVNKIVCESISTLLNSETMGRKLLEADSEFIITSFIFAAFGSENVSLSLAAKSACITLLRLAGEKPDVSRLLQRYILNDSCLRLIDCDHYDCEDNRIGAYFVLKNASLLNYIISQTLHCFNDDPLLLSNYLIFFGILCRYNSKILDGELKRRICSSLEDFKNELQWSSVSQCCFYALLNCSDTSEAFAEDWVRSASKLLKDDIVSDEMISFSVRLLFAASTTKHGWDSTARHLSAGDVISLLNSQKNSRVCSALHLLRCMFESVHFVNERVAFLQECACEAWKHRNSLDDGVRESLWSAFCAMNCKSSLLIRNACILFLCTPTHNENSKKVREKQLLAAESFLQLEGLPLISYQGLEQFIQKGIYPPGSSGVSAALEV